MQGRVKFFLPSRNFGVVELWDGGAPFVEYLFHGSNVIGEPVRTRDAVEFFLDDSPEYRGSSRLVAVEVQKLEARGIEPRSDGVYQKAW
jgi:hypothetical protein